MHVIQLYSILELTTPTNFEVCGIGQLVKHANLRKDGARLQMKLARVIKTFLRADSMSFPFFFPRLQRYCCFPVDVWQFRSDFILLIRLLLVPTFHFLNKARFVDRVLL